MGESKPAGGGAGGMAPGQQKYMLAAIFVGSSTLFFAAAAFGGELIPSLGEGMIPWVFRAMGVGELVAAVVFLFLGQAEAKAARG